MALLALAGVIGGPSGSEGGTDFKSFVASPPVIEELECEYQYAPDKGGETRWMWLRWQPGACVLRQAPSRSALTNPVAPGISTLVLGHYEDYYWTIRGSSSGPVVHGEWRDRGDRRELRNHIGTPVRIAETNVIGEILNLGVQQPPGSLDWRTDRITYLMPAQRIWVEGELSFGQDGRPSGVRLSLSKESGKRGRPGPAFMRQRILYSYGGAEVPQGLPSTIRVVGEAHEG